MERFRAKSLEDYETSIDGIQKGQFVYGDYYFCTKRMSGIIVTQLCEESGGMGSGLVQVHIEVDSKTLCRNTGVEDINRKIIFGGDIVQFSDYGHIWKRAVEFYGGGFSPFVSRDEKCDFGDVCGDDCLIIGNIYDNPKLLK
jgi:hypothetical protein